MMHGIMDRRVKRIFSFHGEPALLGFAMSKESRNRPTKRCAGP
jgi:hypothetical protein